MTENNQKWLQLSTLWLWLWWLGSSFQSQVAQDSCVEAKLTWAGSSLLSLLWQGLTLSRTQPNQEPSAASQRVWAEGLDSFPDMPGLSFLFNSRGLATQTHLGQTWAHLTIFILKWSVLNLGRIQQIFPNVAVWAVRNRAFQPLRVFAHIVLFWMKVGLFLWKDVFVSVNLGLGNE